MKEFFYKIKGIQRNNRYYIFFGIQVLCIVLYFVSIKGLERPAGLLEAIKFCFMNPGDYFIAILVGIVAWFLFSILLISNLMEIPIIKDILDYDDYYGSYGGYEAYEDISKVKMIVNIVLCIIAFILNTICLSYLIMLIGILIILVVAVIIFTQ